MNQELREALLRELLQANNSVKVELNSEDLKYVINHCLDQRTETPAGIEKLYSREEVKQLLGVDYSTLHRWNVSGYLCSVKIGGKIRYRESDILRIINGQES